MVGTKFKKYSPKMVVQRGDESKEIRKKSVMFFVDGSEIPFPTTVGMYKTG